jgi:hypothetical protein
MVQYAFATGAAINAPGLTVGGNAVIKGSTTVQNLLVNGLITITGNLDVGGNLEVTGSIAGTSLTAGSFSTNGSNVYLGSGSGAAGASASGNSVVGPGSFTLGSGNNNSVFGSAAGVTLTTGTGNLLLGRGADVGSGAVSNAIAVGFGAVAAATEDCQIGPNTLGAGTGQLRYRTQVVADESWIGGGLTTVAIDDNGNLVRGAAPGASQLKSPVETATPETLTTNSSVVGASPAYNNVGGASARGQITATLVGAGVFTVDGTAMANGDRVLVRSEGDAGGLNADANGIYTVTIAGTSLTLDRAEDFDSDDEVFTNVLVNTDNGSQYAGVGWALATPNPIQVGGVGGTPLGFSSNTAFVSENGNLVALGNAAGTGVSVSRLRVTAIGTNAMATGTGGNDASALGHNALLNNTASGSTAFGSSALQALTSGARNTAGGYQALSSMTTQTDCTSFGYQALSAAAGNSNTAFGSRSGTGLTSGTNNVLLGDGIMMASSSATGNVAVGSSCMPAVTLGGGNTTVGYRSMISLTTGTNNVAVGIDAMSGLTTGTANVGIGREALAAITVGLDCTAVGSQAAVSATGSSNTVFGAQAATTLVSGTQNVILGASADVTALAAANRIAIGFQASCTANNTCRIGNAALLGGVESFGAYANISDSRFKKDVETVDLGLNFLTKLRPCRYRMVNGAEGQHYDYGFIAQEVRDVLREMRGKKKWDFAGLKYSKDEDLYFMSYTSFIAPLVRAVQEINERLIATGI